MIIVAEPLVRIAGIEFGTKRTEVRNVLGKAKEFKKSPFSVNTTDDFGVCHVFYDKDDIFEAIEIFGDVEIKINDAIVFPGNKEKAFSAIGSFVEEDGAFINVKKSIGMYVVGDKIESITFGKKDYYKTV